MGSFQGREGQPQQCQRDPHSGKRCLNWKLILSVPAGTPVRHLPQQAVDDGDPPRPDLDCKNVNATPIPLDEATRGYEEFDQSAASKYVLDPHGMIGQRATG
jgi:hypothetical protein